MCWEQRGRAVQRRQAPSRSAPGTRAGVIVTVIADTYFGYCKKEVKTQISYSANLFGNAEEEHSGGALVFASYNLGQEYTETYVRQDSTSGRRADARPGAVRAQPEGHALDLQQPHIVLVPGGAHYSLRHHDRVLGRRRRPASAVDPAARGQGLPQPERLPRRGRRRSPHDRTVVEPHRHRHPRRRRATSRRRSPAAASRRSPRRSPTPSSSGPRSSPNFEADMDSVAAILDRDYSKRFLDPAAERPTPGRSCPRSARSAR